MVQVKVFEELLRLGLEYWIQNCIEVLKLVVVIFVLLEYVVVLVVYQGQIQLIRRK